MKQPNRYGISDVIEYNTRQGPDGVWYPVTWAIIDQRKTINGHEVNDDGSPKHREQHHGRSNQPR